jgi:hypothetical protein
MMDEGSHGWNSLVATGRSMFLLSFTACLCLKGGRPYGVQTWQKWDDIAWKEMTPNEKNEMKQNETK